MCEPGATALPCTQPPPGEHPAWPFRHGHMHHPASRPAPGAGTPPYARLPALPAFSPERCFLLASPGCGSSLGGLSSPSTQAQRFLRTSSGPGANKLLCHQLGCGEVHTFSSEVRVPLGEPCVWDPGTPEEVVWCNKRSSTEQSVTTKIHQPQLTTLFLESRSPAASRTWGEKPLGVFHIDEEL